jgi:hypothetical protein
MKNGGDHGADNWELDWIGFLPGKRESRRYVGKYIITQNDVESEGRFDDIVAYGGWSMDDHFPEGFYYTGGHPTIYHPAPSPWGIPLRALISRNIDNLVFAGRNISVTHAALSSSRVMATCAIMGQALGAAVAMAVKGGTKVEEVDVKKLQATLMDDDCFIPWHERSVSALTLSATTNAEIARNGKDRGEDNLWRGSSGDYIEYSFSEDVDISRIRLVFDSDLNRPYHNMPENYPMKQEGYELPKTLVKEYRIEAESSDGKVTAITEINNRQRLVFHNTALRASRIRLIPISTVGGNDDFRVFSFEIS